jgi:hypothetical protein
MSAPPTDHVHPAGVTALSAVWKACAVAKAGEKHIHSVLVAIRPPVPPQHNDQAPAAAAHGVPAGDAHTIAVWDPHATTESRMAAFDAMMGSADAYDPLNFLSDSFAAITVVAPGAKRHPV